MRYYCYQLCVKHPLPQVSKVALRGQGYNEPQYFHTIFPVGTALIAATDSVSTKLYLHLVDTPEAAFYENAFAQYPPKDRASFLLMLESVSRVSSLLCYRVETIDFCFGDIYDLFEHKCDTTEISFIKACQALYLEVYGRN